MPRELGGLVLRDRASSARWVSEMRSIAFAVATLIGLGSPVQAGECASLVKSACQATTETGAVRRVLKVDVPPPAFAKGDRFPVEHRSLLMNPTRHRLPKVDGAWRYYAMDGVVYKVDNATATVIAVIRDRRTWNLR